MAAAYLEADLGALHRLAELVEQFDRGDLSATGLAAMTQLEDRFGLTPKARQALQWQVLAQGELERREPAAASSSSSTSSAPAANVRRLRAVDPQAASS
jgi:hypothetical protein